MAGSEDGARFSGVWGEAFVRSSSSVDNPLRDAFDFDESELRARRAGERALACTSADIYSRPVLAVWPFRSQSTAYFCRCSLAFPPRGGSSTEESTSRKTRGTVYQLRIKKASSSITLSCLQRHLRLPPAAYRGTRHRQALSSSRCRCRNPWPPHPALRMRRHRRSRRACFPTGCSSVECLLQDARTPYCRNS